MDWVDRVQNYKGRYGILQLLQGSHLDNFEPKTLKYGWVAFHSLTFQLKETRPNALTFLQLAMLRRNVASCELNIELVRMPWRNTVARTGQTTTTSCNSYKCCVKNLTIFKFEANNTQQGAAHRDTSQHGGWMLKY